MPLQNHPQYDNDLADIIETVPKWYVRLGLAVVIVVIIAALIFMNTFKYSTKVTFPIIAEPLYLPFVYSETAEHNIEHMFVEEGKPVSVNTRLFSIKGQNGKSEIIQSPVEGIFKILYEANSSRKLYSVVPADSSYNYTGIIQQADNVKGLLGKPVTMDLQIIQHSASDSLTGIVEEIQFQAANNVYVVKINPHNLSTAQRTIVYPTTIRGVGTITIRDKTVFQALFGSLFKH
jgi:hypothetical protein